jgi:uncharacterized protein (TIGR00255 family)
MISMTGFGRSGFTLGGRAYRVEVRSVNNRFLDVKLRLPWVDGELESRAVALVRRRAARGRVDVAILEERGSARSGVLRIDLPLAQELGAALRQLAAAVQCDLATAARLVDTRLELLGGSELRSTDELWGVVEEALATALDGLEAMRRQEGAAMAADLSAQLDALERRAGQVTTLVAEEPERQRARLESRLARLRVDGVDPARVAEEVALYADRCDVSEELARLASHVAQLRGMIADDHEVGRKVEFLLQEVHRELNTIASKALSAEVAHLVVEAKAAVEKMREQSQNVE